jgi:hypothetical protein
MHTPRRSSKDRGRSFASFPLLALAGALFVAACDDAIDAATPTDETGSRSSLGSDAGTDAATAPVPARSAPSVGVPIGAASTDSDAGTPTTDASAGASPDSSTPPDAAVLGALTALTASLGLSPTFDASVHDYAMRCAAGSNSVTFTVGAPTGVTLSVATAAGSSEITPGTVTLALTEDDAAIFSASAGGTSAAYWVRCLPHDFPSITLTRYTGAGSATPGYYLFGNTIVASGESGFAIVTDGNGTPVWYRRSTGGAINTDLLDTSSISYTAPLGPVGFGASPNGHYDVFHLDTGATESVQASPGPTDHHELRELPNGDRMLFAYPLVSGVDLTGLESFGANQTIADCVIQEVDPTGAVVWQWTASDHIDPVTESTWPQTDTINGQTIVDVFHCNSIDVNAAGDLLVSFRHADAVFYIARATGTVLWKLGGAAASKDDAQLLTITSDPETAFYRQHDARFLPNGDVSLFDDHTAMSGAARGVEYALDFEEATATPMWQYSGAAASAAMGSFRRYADGSSLVGWGLGGTRVLSEVDASGNLLLDVAFGAGDYSYRAVKVPLGAVDIGRLRATAGAP